MKPVIHIIDDDSSARTGLQNLVEAVGHEARAYASALEFLETRADVPAGGCILLDMKMPGMTGEELQDELLKRGQDLPIVFVSGTADVPAAARAMRKGAVHVLTKPVDADELFIAISESLERNAELRARAAEVEELKNRLFQLTDREMEVLTWVITGKLNKQIAAGLGIAENTVKIHRGRVMQKLNTWSAVELARLCGKAGIVPASGPEA